MFHVNPATGILDASQGRNLLLPGALRAGASFGRASSATYLNASGMLVEAAADAPRFAGSAMRLMLEGARSNLCTYSAGIGTAPWSTNGIAATASATAPDGSGNAALITENTGNSTHFVSSAGIAFSSGGLYTLSIFAKAGSRAFLQLVAPGAAFDTNAYANFDLSAGALGTVGVSAAATIQPIGNGWYRCAITATAAATATAAFSPFLIASATAARSSGFSGSGQNLLLWGAQVTMGTFVSSHIPTAAATATRAADLLTAPIAGLFGSGTGTLLLSAMLPQPAPAATDQIVAQIDDGSDNNRLRLRNPAGGASLVAEVVSAGGVTASLALGSMTAGNAFKLALAWSGGSLSALRASGTVMAASATLPSGLTTLRAGNGQAGNAGLFGEIGTLRALPYRAADGMLAGLLSTIA